MKWSGLLWGFCRTTANVPLFSGDKCNADNNSLSISILCMYCQEYPTSVTFWECSIKHNLWKKVVCSSTTSRRSQEYPHKSVFWSFSMTDLSTIWPSWVSCETNSNKFLSRLHPSSWWQEGMFLNFWTLFIVDGDTVSPTSLQCFLPVLYLLTFLNLLHTI